MESVMITLRDKIQEILNEEVDIIEGNTTDCIREVMRIIDLIDSESYDDAREEAWVLLANLEQIEKKLY